VHLELPSSYVHLSILDDQADESVMRSVVKLRTKYCGGGKEEGGIFYHDAKAACCGVSLIVW